MNYSAQNVSFITSNPNCKKIRCNLPSVMRVMLKVVLLKVALCDVFITKNVINLRIFIDSPEAHCVHLQPRQVLFVRMYLILLKAIYYFIHKSWSSKVILIRKILKAGSCNVNGLTVEDGSTGPCEGLTSANPVETTLC